MRLNLDPKPIGVALVGVVNPLIAVLLALEVITWSAEQVTLVYSAANTGVLLIVAVLAHFRVGTKQEPVMLGSAVTAFTTALLLCLIGFDVLVMTKDTVALVVSLEVAAFGVVNAVFGRELVTAQATESTAVTSTARRK